MPAGARAILGDARSFRPEVSAEIEKQMRIIAEGTALTYNVAREPMTGSEDFARFLERVPGCFAFIGNCERSAPLHNPAYDFNDERLLFGARFHAAVIRQQLPECLFRT